ncbi:hypothetical protein [Vibrio sp. 10N.261.55.A7]|uniref:hypothetical protein n=1 Tax=Vibrio TaxID=662 RepID=UPI000C85BD0F|nr:hypothetical protein [Vibrio sp. 10N.261.55.A7]PMK00223.1 hypothetical protein BCU12_20235 [Vibrio sp. 10N.261.55.A7]
MSPFSLQQENALAMFKNNLHLPNNGFHTLIIELSKEYQLPFQRVRKALINSQKSVERKIKQDFDNLVSEDLSQENWLKLIRTELTELAKDNQSVLDNLNKNEMYIQARTLAEESISSEAVREEILEALFLVYEKVVFKPLLSMLHTSPLYWKLMRCEELSQMTQENRLLFAEYAEYMEAAETLFQLDEAVRNETRTPE